MYSLKDIESSMCLGNPSKLLSVDLQLQEQAVNRTFDIDVSSWLTC